MIHAAVSMASHVQAARRQPPALFNPDGRDGCIRPLRVPLPPTDNPDPFVGEAHVPPVAPDVNRAVHHHDRWGHHSRMVHAAVCMLSPRSSGAPPAVGAVRLWWAGRIYPAPTKESSSSPPRQTGAAARTPRVDSQPLSHVCRTNRKGAQLPAPLRIASCW
jgi:hypothetical protein